MEETLEENPYGLRLVKNILGCNTKAQSRKDKIGKLDFILMKNSLRERHCSEDEETNYRRAKVICKSCIQQRTFKQNKELSKVNNKKRNSRIRN